MSSLLGQSAFPSQFSINTKSLTGVEVAIVWVKRNTIRSRKSMQDENGTWMFQTSNLRRNDQPHIVCTGFRMATRQIGQVWPGDNWSTNEKSKAPNLRSCMPTYSSKNSSMIETQAKDRRAEVVDAEMKIEAQSYIWWRRLVRFLPYGRNLVNLSCTINSSSCAVHS